ncbi:cyclopentanol dehydrogenase [Luminiphilus syltensis NOR5-1B]|uniref:Cyclopentanol dehydrogenase n=1 Tax=Luminiphilus syltensis NOR5-1B TaxID=565045 RepID=B8KSP2_9GAMM|nr:SDR family oxidoreductase [Luminiphilus syltensis]EED35550.1 cyclopentanol dehydrogenase [Luminiphilus syltensis NOR5-1B]
MSGKLQGKVALITGGTNGIGKAAVEGFTREGASVIFTGNNETAGADISQATGATFVKHAVQDVEGWKALVAQIRAEHGRLDIAFANAGTNSGDSNIEDVEVDAWKRLIDINLTGAMLTIKSAVELMRENPGGPSGSIILNSSINGILALAGDVTYSTTKGALRLLAKSTAVHLGKSGIRCNTIHPGVTETPLIEGAINSAPDQAAARNMLENVAPMGRMAKMEEIVSLVMYLASDDASFVTGSELVIDGGSTAGLPGV